MKKIINPWQHLADKGYDCFGCAEHNPIGLKMEFYEDGDEVVSHWRPHLHHQGWLNTLHGGIQATLFDEIGMWFVVRKLQTSGMTTRLEVSYRRPVAITPDTQLEIRARLVERKRNFVTMEATLTHQGECCSTAVITYFCVSQERARQEFYFSGCHLEGEEP